MMDFIQRRIDDMKERISELEKSNVQLQARLNRYQDILEKVFRAHEYRDAHTIEQMRGTFFTLRNKQSPDNSLTTNEGD